MYLQNVVAFDSPCSLDQATIYTLYFMTYLTCLTLSLSNQSISQATNQCILVYDKREIGIDAVQACQITSSSTYGMGRIAMCATVGTMRAVTSLVANCHIC